MYTCNEELGVDWGGFFKGIGSEAVGGLKDIAGKLISNERAKQTAEAAQDRLERELIQTQKDNQKRNQMIMIGGGAAALAIIFMLAKKR